MSDITKGLDIAGLAKTGLGGLLASPALRDTWYNKKEVSLDGYQFINCRFDDCKLIVSSTNFSIINCYIDEKSVIIIGNEIKKIIQLFNRNYEWVYEKIPSFAPTRNKDGTITIKT